MFLNNKNNNARIIFAALAYSAVALAQNPVTVDRNYQVRTASNLNIGDSVVNITNGGALGAGLAAGTTASTTGAICANVYAFSPDEQMVSCCSCPVTPNGLVSLSVKNDLISNTLTPAVPTSIVIKLLASTPVGGSCAGSAASPGLIPFGGAGLLAWGTTLHAPVGSAGGTSTGTIACTAANGNPNVIVNNVPDPSPKSYVCPAYVPPAGNTVTAIAMRVAASFNDEITNGVDSQLSATATWSLNPAVTKSVTTTPGDIIGVTVPFEQLQTPAIAFAGAPGVPASTANVTWSVSGPAIQNGTVVVSLVTTETTAAPAALTETQFLPAILSAGELTRLTQLCTFINANGSGFGVCRSCRLGGLGGNRN